MDRAEFTRIAKTWSDSIYRVALHALRNPHDAEDILQTVLLKLLEHPDDFESEEHVRNWLIRVAVNESSRLARSSWRRTTVPLQDFDGPVTEDQDRIDLYNAVMRLDRNQRLAVYLYYYEGFPVSEVAGFLNAKQSTVQSWLMRAREKLRRELTETPEAPSHSGKECLGFAVPGLL